MTLYSVVYGAELTYQSGWDKNLRGHEPGLMQAGKHFSMSKSYSSIALECFFLFCAWLAASFLLGIRGHSPQRAAFTTLQKKFFFKVAAQRDITRI